MDLKSKFSNKNDRGKSNASDRILSGPLLLSIFLFAMPLALSSILQQFFNAADVAVVGRFAGDSALAAVGSNSAVVALFVNSFVGLAVGANVVIARYIGCGESERVHDVVHTAILFGAVAGICLFAVGQLIARPLLVLIGAPDEVMEQAVLYLRVYFIGAPFIIVYNFGAAVLRSIGDTRRPMYCLMLSGVLNIGLNLLFVIVFHMDVAGVALATAIANAVACAFVIRILSRETSVVHLNLKDLKIQPQALKRIVQIGGPAMIQSMVFSVSNICIQSGINSFGTSAVAGAAAAANFEYFDYFMMNSFNQAAVTYIGQNHAAGNYDRCKKIYGICLLEAVACCALMILMFICGRQFWVSLYSTSPEVIEYAFTRMFIVLVFHLLCISYEITGSVLRGMGRSLMPALITMIGSVLFRIFWLLTVFRAVHTYEFLMRVYPASWVLTGCMMITAYVLTRKSNYSSRSPVSG